MRVLAGDIGGTKTLLQLAEGESGAVRQVVREQRFECARYDGLAPMLREFLGAGDPIAIDAACFAVAGPIVDLPGGQHVKVTNLPWEIDTAELSRELGSVRPRLINDFQAVGYGIEALEAADLVTLQPGRALAGRPRAVLGAGTGLGVGSLVWCQDHYEALPSEGGHAGFAPRDEEQTELLRYLRRAHPRVSYDRLVSGPGLVAIYRFLRDTDKGTVDPSAASLDTAADISQAALSGGNRLARQALDLFVRIYGGFAGDLAMTTLAAGGVYVAGGIAPRIIDKLTDGTFLHAFRDKGRMALLLATIPVQVIINPKVGLLGAALAASRR